MASSLSMHLRKAPPPTFVDIGPNRYRIDVVDEKGNVVTDQLPVEAIAKKIFKGQTGDQLLGVLEGDFDPNHPHVTVKKIKAEDQKVDLGTKKRKIETAIEGILRSPPPPSSSTPQVNDPDDLSDVDEVDSDEEEEMIDSIDLPDVLPFPDEPAKVARPADQDLSLMLEGVKTEPNARDFYTQLAAQASQLTPTKAIDLLKLKRNHAEAIAKKTMDQEDCDAVFAFMQGLATERHVTGHKTIARGEYVRVITNAARAPTVGSKDAKLLQAAFANFILSAHSGNHHDYPPIFYERLQEALGRINSIDGFMVLEQQGTGYKLVDQWSRSGKPLNPSRTLFVCRNPADSNYLGLERNALNSRKEDPSKLAHSNDPKIATQYNAKTVNIPDNGNCLAEAVIDALDQRNGRYFAPAAWKMHIEEKGLELRRDTMSYLYQHPEEFHEESDFQTFLNAYDAIRQPSKRTAYLNYFPSRELRKKLEELLDRNPKRYHPDEKNFLIQTYAATHAEPGRYLDEPFLLACAKVANFKIAILRTENGQEVVESIYSDKPHAKIEKSEFLFLHHKTNHYNTFNRRHQFFEKDNGKESGLDRAISHYHLTKVKPFKARQAFIDAVEAEDEAQVKATLKTLKKDDPLGYLNLKEKFGALLQKRPSVMIEKLKGKKLLAIMEESSLTTGTASPSEARAAFYLALKSGENLDEALKEVQRVDPLLYTVLTELVDVDLDTDPQELADTLFEIAPKGDPLTFFEAEIAKRPYLGARLAFFDAMEKVQADPSKGNKKALKQAYNLLKVEDRVGYLAIRRVLPKTQKEEILATLETRGQDFLKRLKAYIKSNKSLIEASNNFGKALNSNDQKGIRDALIEAKTSSPGYYLYIRTKMGIDKPEDDIQAVMEAGSTSLNGTINDETLVRHDFFLAMHRYEGLDDTFAVAMEQQLQNLEENDPEGFKALTKLIGQNPYQATAAQLKGVSLDDFLEELEQPDASDLSSAASVGMPSVSDDTDVDDVLRSSDDDDWSL